MPMAVFTGMIDIEFVVSVFDGREFQTAARQLSNQIDGERGLAGILESGNAENTHVERIGES
jgi:hypothetical protein